MYVTATVLHSRVVYGFSNKDYGYCASACIPLDGTFNDGENFIKIESVDGGEERIPWTLQTYIKFQVEGMHHKHVSIVLKACSAYACGSLLINVMYINRGLE